MPGRGRGSSKELAEHLWVAFTASEQPLLTLFMDVLAPAHGGPWPPLLLFHGWHEDLTAQRDRARALARRGFCVLNLNLRGRAATVGLPDANGWEVRDAADAVQVARRDFPQLCAEHLPPRAFGAAGGGGNVYALVGKCPDLLSAAVVWGGVSDYAQWFEWNEAGQYRDEMQRWIASSPRDFPEAYMARAGIAVAPNRLCPLLVMHGRDDDCVPVDQAKAYVAAQKSRKVPPLFQYIELRSVGHQIPDDPHLVKSADFLLRHDRPVYVEPRGRYVVAGFLFALQNLRYASTCCRANAAIFSLLFGIGIVFRAAAWQSEGRWIALAVAVLLLLVWVFIMLFLDRAVERWQHRRASASLPEVGRFQFTLTGLLTAVLAIST